MSTLTIVDPAAETVAGTTTEPPPSAASTLPLPATTERLDRPASRHQTTYTVGEGETLWLIAARKEIYNDALLWPLLYKANRDQIKDPAQIFPGQQLSIPRNLSETEKEVARETAKKSGIFQLVSPPVPGVSAPH